MRVARIAAGFLNRFRRSLALTPTLSRRERGIFWARLFNAKAVALTILPDQRLSHTGAGSCMRSPERLPFHWAAAHDA